MQDVPVYNANPTVFAPSKPSKSSLLSAHSLWWDEELDVKAESEDEEIKPDEIFDLIRSITDPEHPLTLEQLAVVSSPQVAVSGNFVNVEFTPTVPHCGMSAIIGLSIRVRLLRSLPNRFKVDVRVKPGSHNSENSVNKQLNDKERVAAALENDSLIDVVEKCLSTAGRRGQTP
ncbi:hypothetical protein BD410DRAFT_782766 [Rickenella mellea]|uniref:MIP18 family-like domain-containing protein n=1 Tax=Rickenella mellea TaxID=50990 RepID=A0A4Y7QJ08_9AGAM|nr:hypothetical protein BD410DRAFT_782766 [Rickenella mellea]